jgi:hypothetical protein
MNNNELGEGFGAGKKKKKPGFLQAFRVTDRVRTGDPQNHNLVL